MGLFDFFKPKDVTRLIKQENESATRNIQSDISINYNYHQIAAPDSDIADIRVLERISYNGLILSKNPDDYPRWFDYDFGIKDPYDKIIKLIERGLVCIAPPDICLKKRTVTELKEELQNQGLSLIGKKSELIQRILEEGELSPLFVPEVAILTDKGAQYLKKHEEEAFAESLQRFEISIREYFQKKQNLPDDISRESLVIELLNDKQFSEGLDFWTYYDIQEELANLYDRNGNKPNALLHYIANAYYSCCVTAKYSSYAITIDAAHSNPIFILREYYQDDMIDFCKKLIVPETGASARYDIDFFRNKILNIIN